MWHSTSPKGKGKVSFEGFVSFMMSRQRQQSVTEEEMLEAFHVFDSDGDGYITGEDIRKTMRQLGEELSEADIKDMITEADLDKDGRINFSGKGAITIVDICIFIQSELILVIPPGINTLKCE